MYVCNSGERWDWILYIKSVILDVLLEVLDSRVTYGVLSEYLKKYLVVES